MSTSLQIQAGPALPGEAVFSVGCTPLIPGQDRVEMAAAELPLLVFDSTVGAETLHQRLERERYAAWTAALLRHANTGDVFTAGEPRPNAPTNFNARISVQDSELHHRQAFLLHLRREANIALAAQAVVAFEARRTGSPAEQAELEKYDLMLTYDTPGVRSSSGRYI